MIFILAPILAIIMSVTIALYVFWERERDERIFLAVAVGVVSLFVTGITSGISYRVGTANSRHKEVWNFRYDRIQHWTEWTEKVQKSKQVADGTERDKSGTDSNGKATYSTRTKYKTVYYYVTETRGPYWYKTDEYGQRSSITPVEYTKWKLKWRNQKVVKTNKGSAAGYDRVVDGTVSQCDWPDTLETLYPASKIHTYENKVRATSNTFNQGEPTEAELARFPRPADIGNMSPVVSYGGGGLSAEETLWLQRTNAIMGPVHQIHTMLVTFKAEEGRQVCDGVMRSWQGTNKNELVVFVGLTGRRIDWINAESWVDDDTLNVLIEGDWLNKELEGKAYAEYLRKNVPKHWKRKEFTPSFEYIDIEASGTSKAVCFVLCFVLAGGVVAGIWYGDCKGTWGTSGPRRRRNY